MIPLLFTISSKVVADMVRNLLSRIKDVAIHCRVKELKERHEEISAEIKNGVLLLKVGGVVVRQTDIRIKNDKDHTGGYW